MAARPGPWRHAHGARDGGAPDLRVPGCVMGRRKRKQIHAPGEPSPLARSGKLVNSRKGHRTRIETPAVLPTQGLSADRIHARLST
jgi:hypothetical protein